MLKKILLLLIIFTSLNVTAQKYKGWGMFMNAIAAQPYAGKKFRIEAAVKITAIDKDADAGVWARVDLKDKKTGFFNNMMETPIRSSEWKVYVQQGKIDDDAVWLVFGGLFHKRGIFYFDDFKLFIENASGTMERVPIVNDNFEADSIFSNKSWGYNRNLEGYSYSISKDEYFSGKQSCKVDGSNSVSFKDYGSNDSTGKFANVNGIKIYYEEYGSGQPLLLLHGNSESIQSFKNQIPEFAKQYHVIAIDTRGQGKSGEDGKKYTYDLFAEDINALLNHLHLDNVNIVGWSDGGNTGLIMAMQYPNKVKKIVTMGANVFIDKSVVDKWVFKELNKQKKELALDTTAWGKNRVRLIEMLLTEPKHTFEELKKIQCNVMVMAGEKDVIKEKHTKNIAANIKNSYLVLVPNATHELPRKDAPLFNKLVLDFFKKL